MTDNDAGPNPADDSGQTDGGSVALDGTTDVTRVADGQGEPSRSERHKYAGEAPPPDAIARESDFTIERDPDTGEVLPVWQEVPGTGRYVLVKPMPPEEAQRRLPGSQKVDEMADEKALALIREKFIEPDLSGIRSVDDLKAYSVDGLLTTIMNASGFEMSRGVMAQNSALWEMVQGNLRSGNSDAE